VSAGIDGKGKQVFALLMLLTNGEGQEEKKVAQKQPSSSAAVCSWQRRRKHARAYKHWEISSAALLHYWKHFSPLTVLNVYE
jgi:hypothetical protein